MKAILTTPILVLGILVAAAWSAGEPPPAPGPKEKCPVCGMFVAKYPDWVASLTLADGSRFYFDGAKDMFKFLFRIEKYHPGHDKGDVAAIFVTEYYEMKPIDGRQAIYVMDSDVYGPMGRELIPFAGREDAEAFKRDHKGRRLLRFEEITPAIIERLD